MYALSMRGLKRKRVFLKIAKRARQIIDEKNIAAREKNQKEINNAIKREQSFSDKSAKCIIPSDDIKAITERVGSLKRRVSEITEEKKHMNIQEIIELNQLIRNAKEKISDLKNKKSKK